MHFVRSTVAEYNRGVQHINDQAAAEHASQVSASAAANRNAQLDMAARHLADADAALPKAMQDLQSAIDNLPSLMSAVQPHVARQRLLAEKAKTVACDELGSTLGDEGSAEGDVESAIGDVRSGEGDVGSARTWLKQGADAVDAAVKEVTDLGAAPQVTRVGEARQRLAGADRAIGGAEATAKELESSARSLNAQAQALSQSRCH